MLSKRTQHLFTSLQINKCVEKDGKYLVLVRVCGKRCFNGLLVGEKIAAPFNGEHFCKTCQNLNTHSL